MTQLLCKMALSHDEWTRMLLPATGFVAFILPAGAAIVKLIRHAVQKYSVAVKEAGRGHTSGPPEVWVLLDRVEFDVRPPSRSSSSSWRGLKGKLEEMAAENVAAQLVPTLKMAKAFFKKG